MCNSLIYLKSNGEKLNCYNYVNQAKNNRKDYIPIKYITKRTIHPTAIEIDIKTTIIILDEVIRNQITTNNPITALNNRIFELEKSL